MTKKVVISTIPVIPPAFVHSLQKPSFLCIFSNQSDGGKKKGKRTVSKVKLTVGADSASIADLIATRLIILLGPNIYSGPEIPPSFLILQKCTAINIIAMNGIPIQCRT